VKSRLLLLIFEISNWFCDFLRRCELVVESCSVSAVVMCSVCGLIKLCRL
jgi:hypothetical protein